MSEFRALVFLLKFSEFFFSKLSFLRNFWNFSKIFFKNFCINFSRGFSSYYSIYSGIFLCIISKFFKDNSKYILLEVPPGVPMRLCKNLLEGLLHEFMFVLLHVYPQIFLKEFLLKLFQNFIQEVFFGIFPNFFFLKISISRLLIFSKNFLKTVCSNFTRGSFRYYSIHSVIFMCIFSKISIENFQQILLKLSLVVPKWFCKKSLHVLLHEFMFVCLHVYS